MIPWCARSRDASACFGVRADTCRILWTWACSLSEILACGAELKNTFCLTKGTYAILSQHIGDLENYETLVFFEETLANLKKLFRVEPRAVAYDLHPNYMSSRFALKLPLEQKVGVQHHHAHIASCMAENHLRGKVIGVAFDGTGYGTDAKDLGRGIPGRRLRGIRAAGPFALCTHGGWRCGGTAALAHGAQLSARHVWCEVSVAGLAIPAKRFRKSKSTW